MKLKIKLWRWSAGVPVAMLNKKTAEKIGVHTQDRISIRTFEKNSREMSTIIDTIGLFVKKDEIAISSEVKEILGLHEGQWIEVNLSETPRSLNYIKEKLNGKTLSKVQIKEIIKDIVENSLSEAEIAIFISGVYEKGMNFMETVYLVEAILEVGKTLSFGKNMVVDKHCIGGIPGNRTTPIVVSICAAAGLIFPKTSSRAITSAAGTADTIETIARVDYPANKLKEIVKKVGACLAFGGSLEIVPADSKIIRIEKELKIDVPALLLASIMSKKLAVGSNIILIDIPCGKNGKVTKRYAKKLKRQFEALGKYFKRKLRVVITNGNEPIGNGIGPALEMLDVIAVLDPEKQGPLDLQNKSIFLASNILEMSKIADEGEGISMAESILKSGLAFEKFKQIIKAQDGSISNLKASRFKFSKTFVSDKNSKIKFIDNKKINSLAHASGCPVDKYSGVYLYHHLGEKIIKGDKILTIYAESKPRLEEAIRYYKEQKPVLF